MDAEKWMCYGPKLWTGLEESSVASFYFYWTLANLTLITVSRWKLVASKKWKLWYGIQYFSQSKPTRIITAAFFIVWESINLFSRAMFMWRKFLCVFRLLFGRRKVHVRDLWFCNIISHFIWFECDVRPGWDFFILYTKECSIVRQDLRFNN